LLLAVVRIANSRGYETRAGGSIGIDPKGG
jgi:hypothetical protein